MRTKRVAVLVNGSLLMAGVVAMLCEREGLAITAIHSGDADRMGRLDALSPSVVVLDSGDTAFEGSDSIWSLAERHPEVTVIAVATDSDRIHAVAPRSVVGARSSDLFGLILCGPPSLAEQPNTAAQPDAKNGGQR